MLVSGRQDGGATLINMEPKLHEKEGHVIQTEQNGAKGIKSELKGDQQK